MLREETESFAEGRELIRLVRSTAGLLIVPLNTSTDVDTVGR